MIPEARYCKRCGEYTATGYGELNHKREEDCLNFLKERIEQLEDIVESTTEATIERGVILIKKRKPKQFMGG